MSSVKVKSQLPPLEMPRLADSLPISTTLLVCDPLVIAGHGNLISKSNSNSQLAGLLPAPSSMVNTPG